jgi:tRNA (uracil-5-)-methyltransferase
VLNGIKVHGRVLKMAPAPVPVEGALEAAAARPADAEEDKERTLSHQVTPLCDMTYEEQIAFKRHLLVASLEKVTKRLLTDAASGSGVEWVRELAKGPVCPLEAMHHSPDLNGYRNKNEFTIGYGEDKKPLVGFRFGRFADGNTTVGCADGVLHTPEEALSVARCMTEFLRDRTKLGCWIPQNHAGVWRMIMVRHNRVGEVMALVQYSGNNCSKEELDAELAKLKIFFAEKVAAGAMKLTSLFFQEHNEPGNRANDDTTVTLVSGEATFSESILGLNFRISPSAFFQVFMCLCRIRVRLLCFYQV